MRLTALICASVFVFGCGSDDDPAGDVAPDNQDNAGDNQTDNVDEPAPLVWCDGATRSLYDPLNTELLSAFPDDWYTVDAPTGTGLRVNFTDDNTGWKRDVPTNFQSNVFELNDLDGFGTTAGIFLRFSGEVGDLPGGFPRSLNDDAVRLVEIRDDGVTEVPFEARLTDDDTTAVLVPMIPLRPRALHAAIVTKGYVAADGHCIAPSSALRGLLTGEVDDPSLQRLAPKYAQMLKATGLRADEVSAAIVFTTQSVVDQSLDVLEDIRARDLTWSTAPTCNAQDFYRSCTGVFEGADYRGDDKVFVDGTPQSFGDYPVNIWLPNEGTGPFPTVIFGHGIGGDRSQGGLFAQLLADLGIAVVGIDAVAHGSHPSGSGGGGQGSVFMFFAIDLISLGLDGLVLRDNWRQSTWDKVQLLEVLAAQPDIDGDGQPDIDLDNIAYMGVSLGGIMGSEFMALDDRVGSAVMDVCGGRLSSIIEDSGQFGSLVSIAAAGASEGDVTRFFQMAQALLERADPANFAPHLLGERLPGTGSRAPNVLLQIAIDDEVIPNSSSWYLARSMFLPQLAPVVVPIDIVPQEDQFPVSANAAEGAVTAGLYQFDRVTQGPGSPVQNAAHGNTPGSYEAVNQSVLFIQSAFAGAAEIIDTYSVIGTPER